jgi:hypothetical protein
VQRLENSASPFDRINTSHSFASQHSSHDRLWLRTRHSSSWRESRRSRDGFLGPQGRHRTPLAGPTD